MAIYIATSRWFIIIASAFYANIAIAIWLSSWPWGLCICIYIPMLLDLKSVILRYGLRTHKRSVSIIKQDCDKWWLQLFCGKQYKGKLIKSRCYRSNLVLILYIQSLTGGRYVVIPRDALSQNQYRYVALQMSSS